LPRCKRSSTNRSSTQANSPESLQGTSGGVSGCRSHQRHARAHRRDGVALANPPRGPGGRRLCRGCNRLHGDTPYRAPPQAGAIAAGGCHLQSRRLAPDGPGPSRPTRSIRPPARPARPLRGEARGLRRDDLRVQPDATVRDLPVAVRASVRRVSRHDDHPLRSRQANRRPGAPQPTCPITTARRCCRERPQPRSPRRGPRPSSTFRDRTRRRDVRFARGGGTACLAAAVGLPDVVIIPVPDECRALPNRAWQAPAGRVGERDAERQSRVTTHRAWRRESWRGP
jgi:hypothetical protein